MVLKMRLDSFLKENKLSQREFGQRLVPAVTQGLMSQWIKGKTRITLDYALQISDLSGGRVSPRDCALMYAASEASLLSKPAEHPSSESGAPHLRLAAPSVSEGSAVSS